MWSDELEISICCEKRNHWDENDFSSWSLTLVFELKVRFYTDMAHLWIKGENEVCVFIVHIRYLDEAVEIENLRDTQHDNSTWYKTLNMISRNFVSASVGLYLSLSHSLTHNLRILTPSYEKQYTPFRCQFCTNISVSALWWMSFIWGYALCSLTHWQADRPTDRQSNQQV